MSQAVLRVENLSKIYDISVGMLARKIQLHAVSGVSFALQTGKTLAVVGESGCGKSTLARLITMIQSPSEGSLYIEDQKVEAAQWRELRRHIQIVFQDPYGSLNPRHTIGAILQEPLKNYHPEMNRADRISEAHEMLKLVGLRSEHFDRYPHMFSGGQRQRIAIARALMLKPKIIVLDEPVSALDLSIQSQILNLLNEIQDRLGVSYIFISHDLSVVKHIADSIMVMYLGQVAEYGSTEAIFSSPKHPYTKALFSATPIADPTVKKHRIRLEGDIPSPLDLPKGCIFSPRCWLAEVRCHESRPTLEGSEHKCACWLAES